MGITDCLNTWFYISAFECVVHSRNFTIPTVIPAEYVRKAESIASASYDHSETFSSVSLKTIYFLICPHKYNFPLIAAIESD